MTLQEEELHGEQNNKLLKANIADKRLKKMEVIYESKTIRKAYMRKMQDY
jgi:hypothetical protein